MAEAVRRTGGRIFEIERRGETILVVSLTDLRECEYQRIEAGAEEVLKLLGGGLVRNVVLDFHQTDYYGSTALGFFVKLWKRVRMGGGRMAFCNLSDHEKEILQVTSLDKLWPISASREQALQAVKE